MIPQAFQIFEIFDSQKKRFIRKVGAADEA